MKNRIEVVYGWVESKQSYMWLFKDTGKYSNYHYIYKMYTKPTKKQIRLINRWCLQEFRSWEYSDDLWE